MVQLYEGLVTGIQQNTRIEANPEPLGLEDDLLGYTLNSHYKPLLKVRDMFAIERELKKDEDALAEVSKVLLRRISHHMARHLYKHDHHGIEVYGERHQGFESRALEIADDLALETRLFPSLVLLHQHTLNGKHEEPRAVLRLDTLMRYQVDPADKKSPYVHITAKSGELDEERSWHIGLGMMYLAKLLGDRHELLFFSPADVTPGTTHLTKLLKSQNMRLLEHQITESTDDLRAAARYAIERYSERETIIIPRRKLRLALAH